MHLKPPESGTVLSLSFPLKLAFAASEVQFQTFAQIQNAPILFPLKFREVVEELKEMKL